MLRTWTATLCLATLMIGPAHAQKLSRAEVAKRGKAATAILLTQTSGTAFAIHPSGLFVTSERALPYTGEDVDATLVLNPGEKSQLTLKAKIVRRDRELGLALVRAEKAKDLPYLQVGSQELTELAELVLLGYPHVRKTPKMTEYPAVVVDVGTITSLHRKDGELTEIEMKRGPAVMTAGGPALDETGAVVGVLGHALRGETVKAATLRRFLSTPDFQFVPPVLTRTNQHQPAEYKVELVAAIAPAKPWTVELVLRSGDQPERRHKMNLQDGVYRTSAVPVPLDGELLLDVAVHFQTGSVSGLVADREIRVGKTAVKLSACEKIQLGPQPQIHLRDGKVLKETVDGLDAVEIAVGGQTLKLDLAKASAIHLLASRPPAAVECTLIARQGDKESARFQTRLPIRGIDLIEPADLTGSPIKPTPLTSAKVVKTLPDIASDIVVGGGGRYLVLHLPKLKKLAVFDVNEGAIARYIPLTEDKVLYSASLEKVVVGLPAKGILERWNLRTGEKELTRTTPTAGDITSVLLGSASRGPLLVNDTFLDLHTLRPLPIKTWTIPQAWSPVSADGTVFGAWKTNQSPSESASFVLQGEVLHRYDAGEMGHVAPGPDGRVVFTARGAFTNQLKTLRGSPGKGTYCIPAVEGNFFLSLTSAAKNEGGKATVHLIGNDAPLVRDIGISHGIHFDGWDRTFFGPWKRIFMIPSAKVVVVFPEGNDRLELHRFDVEEALEKSGQEYLVVMSRPPQTAQRGAEFRYPVAVKSKRGDVKYQLTSAPPDMTIAANGVISWNIPADLPATSTDVILAIRDGSGQEVFHTFTVHLQDAGPKE